jgi:hypothetical protein
MNNIRQIKIILYRLKMNFGQLINIMTVRTMTQVVTTGAITMDERVIKVKRAIILDAKISRDFIYDLSFIAANKNFTYGGLFDTSSRTIIIDGIDLPRDYVPTLNDRCVHNGERYQFKKINPTVFNIGYIIDVQHLDSQKIENIEEPKIGHATSILQGETHA